jgi:uncharacterized membrane protein
MTNPTQTYRLLSILVTLGLLLQAVAPAFLWRATPVVAAQTAVAETVANLATALETQPTAVASEPAALTHPLTVARVQSRYQSGGPVTISYHIHNTLPPTFQPNVDLTAPFTDTVELLAQFPIEQDMNSLRDLSLTTELAAGATYLDSSLPPAQNGGLLTWELDDLLPGDTAVLTLTLLPPVSAPNFTNLDNGATATAVLWHNPIAASARPAALAPDSLPAATLQATVDADLFDEDMLWATAVFQQDPLAIFNYAQGLAYEPYAGSLRGTRGTLWGAAGSSMDQASFLIAALRAAGIPARYRQGTLSVADAQTLLASMFIERPGVAGYLPDDAATADPLNDRELLALAQEHWWVEAYLPGQGWTDLDPSFADAAVGQSFAAPGSHDRIAEIPDALRHKLTLELTVERFNSFPIGGANLSTFVPLTGTFPVAQLAAKSLILGHIVETKDLGGLVFGTVEHTYTPYFGVNGDEFVLVGDSFQDLLTNFPLASQFTTAEWITISIEDIAGNSQTFTREVKDIIGQATRLLGGASPEFALDADTPFITFGDSFVINTLPHHLRQFHLLERQQTRFYYDLLAAARLVDMLPRSGDYTPEEEELSGEAFLRQEQARALLFALTGLEFARLADPVSDAMPENLGVKFYYDLPRLIVMQGTGEGESGRRTMDLRNTEARAVVLPGQSVAAAPAAQWIKAVAESRYEGLALLEATGPEAITAERIFAAAQTQGIEFVYITPDKFDLLDLYLPDPNGYGYAAAALIAGREVLIPQAPVLIDGEPRLGWWEIDPASGTAVSVLDDGTHGAATEYGKMIKKVVSEVKKAWDKAGKKVYELWTCIAENVVPALNGGTGNAVMGGGCAGGSGLMGAGDAPATTAVTNNAPWYYLPDHLCPSDNCGLAQFVVPDTAAAPMPLPEISFQYDLDRLPRAFYAGQLIPVSDNGAGGSPAFSLTPSGSGATLPLEPYDLNVTASANFDGELEVWRYAPPGWRVAFSGGQAEITPPEGTPAGDYTILLVGQARHDRSLIATAQHTVTIPEQEALSLSVAVEPNITIPIGPETADPSNQTNDGQAEIPDSAFRIDLYNASHLPKSVQLTVSGAPAGWVVLNGRFQTAATLDLPAYEYTRSGLYVLPPSLPAPGTSFTLEITASDGGSLSQTETIVWTMPGQAHNFLEVSPVLYAEPNGSVDFELGMSNVGNASGSFPIEVTTPLTSAIISNLQSPVSLNPSQSAAQTPTLNVGAAAVLGQRYPVQFSSPAPDSYTQYAFAELQIVSPESGRLFAAANSCTLNDSLGAKLKALALAVVELEYWCSVGDCPLPLRDGAAAAGQLVVSGANVAASPTVLLALSGVETAVSTLATAANNSDILTAVSDLSLAIESLSGNLCQVEQRRVNGRFTPYVQAILLGDSASFSLDVTNQGTLTTSYAITLTGLPDGDLFYNETIPPGATTSVPVAPAPNVMGNFNLTADIVADIDGDVEIRRTAVARLNVVDKFIQVTQVVADPAFVETGISSTSLSVEVANFAGVALAANAETMILAPDGDQLFATAVPLNILAGNPRLYDLAEVDTSGWAAGVYTVTVALLDGDDNLIPDGRGYGYFSVGQALQLSQAVYPEIVAPGTVTVTTIITSVISNQSSVNGNQSGTIYDAPLTDADLAYLNPTIPNETHAVGAGLVPDPDAPAPLLGQPQGLPVQQDEAVEEERPFTDEITFPLTPSYEIDTETPELAHELTDDALATPHTPANALFFSPTFTRTEQNDPAWSYTGTWTNVNLGRASGGSHWRNATAGSTAELAFDGTWVSLGFITDRFSGHAVITIDGDDYGILDLYRNEESATSFLFDGLPPGPHTLEIEVLGTANPFASNVRVQLDYADYGDGSLLPDGDFEEDDPRLLTSNGWTSVSYAGASGGSYLRANTGTAWFPFAGDSFTLHSMAYSSAGQARLFVDGVYLDTIDLYAPVFASSAITRTFAYEGLGSGPHILQIISYRDQVTIDKITTPGTAPFVDTNPPLGSVTRFEADHPAILYNGVPFTQTASSWSRLISVSANRASGGEYIRSATAGDTVTINFEGEWIDLGFIADRWSGHAAITIDGDDYGVIDLYRNEETPTIYRFDGLPPGPHTLGIEALGTANPFASSSRVQLDFADYGDGSLLPDGDFEEDDPRLLTSSGWTVVSDAVASGGSYLRAGTGTAWFPFAGDSFTLHSIAHSNAGKALLFVDGVYLDTINMFAPVFPSSAITRTFSYEGLGSGHHILQISSYQGQVNIDKFTTPGSGPFIDPNPPVTGVTRFEADHPSIRYNGVPFTQTATTWTRVADGNATRASAGEYIRSGTANDTIAFTFEGTWLGIGFATDTTGGQAEIAIDGQPVETIDLYSHTNDMASVYYRDLGAGAHTVTITVLGTSHPNATGTRIYLDYFDVWDGQPLAEGTFEEDSERLILSNGWGRTLDPTASGGGYASSTQNVTAWFPFTGESFTYHGRTRFNYQELELRLNGQPLGQFDMYSYDEDGRTYSFDNLGAGPHILEIRQYRDPITVDAVSSPALEPAYEPPAPAAIVRYEENHPAMRYNGHPFRTMPQSWNIDGGVAWSSSGGNSVSTSTAGNSWSMSFDGQWVNLGFRSSTGQVEIFINGASQGIFDTSGGVNGVKNFPFTLTPGFHTVQVVAISGIMAPDYMDVWQGASVDDGWYDALFEDEATGLFHFSYKRWWLRTADTYAYNGLYLYNFPGASNNIWFNFVGTDLTILGYQRAGTTLQVVIDGVDVGMFDMDTPTPFRNQPYALHFEDLGEGPHTVQVFLPSAARIDAFEVNPDGFYSYMPEVIWYDTAVTDPATNPDFYDIGLMSSIAIGDLNGDGLVELVAPSTNGTLYVYRGDGQDAGGGSPLIWSTDVVGVAAEPALADLTGDGNAEIILSGYTGTYAFAHDGTQLWHNPDPRAVATDSGGTTGWGGPTIGNLDLDPEPEIVIAASQDALYVLDHMGNTLWSVPVADRFVTIPVLADITGDGILDIIVADKWDLRVYDYFNGGQLVWQYTQPDGLAGGQGAFGAPAVADITGDGQPEIIINWGVFIEAIRADGSLLWQYNTGNNAHFRPSPVTVADVTGDGQMNLITASAIAGFGIIFNHTLMVLDADGNLVWEQLVGDNSASASGVAAQDLTGNGVWEVVWNGSQDGLLIIRGSDGKRLFNEPFTRSGTVTDYPTLGDVDGDGVADIVLGGYNGIFVLSHVGHWADSRPLWNQHNYHVTNINDDWSVPINEQNSWELHNTYRTQTPDRSPAPAYQMVFTYTEGLPNVTVLINTASISLTAAPPLYNWEYRQEWYQPTITTTFDSLLTDMQPGETRQVSAGTEVAYRLPSGFNTLTLPPLYVTAPGLGELAPAAQSVVVGGTAVYTLTLSNVGDSAAVYSLFLGGIPAAWLSYPATVPVGAGETAVVTITVTIPPNADPDTLTLWLDVDNGSGGADDFTAELTLFNGLEMALTPFSQEGMTGRPLTYTLTISNLETAERTYALTTGGLADVSLPNSVTVAGNGVEMVAVTAVPLSHGPQPFAITASAANGATANVDGAAVGDGRFGIIATFHPDTAVTGPGATAVYTLTLSNVGDTADSYSLDLDIPAGWTAELTRYGQPISAIDLPALLFNSVELLLLVTPDENALADSYPITLTAVSLNHDGVGATAGAIAEVTARGVSVAISPASQTIDPTGPTSWDVTVTNTGSVVDSYDLTVSGAPALAGTLSADTVSLTPGASQMVQLTAADLRFLLPGTQTFAVMAQSQAESQIRAEARASFTVEGFVETAVFWEPASATVTNTLELGLTFIVSNTGNLLTEFDLSFAGTGLTAATDTDNILIPPGSAAVFLVWVTAGEPGSYELTGLAQAGGATAAAVAELIFAVDAENLPPIVDAGPDRAVAVNQLVQFSGSAIDPDEDEIVSIIWDFGDGATTSGTLTPTHTYTAAGDYIVTLTVTDSRGGVGVDTLVVSAEWRLHLPLIVR